MTINMTPHEITVISNDRIVTYPQADLVARTKVTRQLSPTTVDDLALTDLVVTNSNIPEPQTGVFYIVSMQTKQQQPNRPDLIVPDSINATRDTNGKVTSVPGFIR